MAGCPGEGLLRAASGVLAAEQGELLKLLHAFTDARLRAASCARRQLLGRLDGGEPSEAAVHLFLRECWEALDGLARETNLCMRRLFPDVGLFPPMQMTRQCTFYVVRKILHEHPDTADHPVSRLLWEATRQEPQEAYVRLSFLYNLSLFVPVPPMAGRLLPGSEDVPAPARDLIRRPAGGDVERCPVEDGSAEIVHWLGRLVTECYRRLSAALSDNPGEGRPSPPTHGGNERHASG